MDLGWPYQDYVQAIHWFSYLMGNSCPGMSVLTTAWVLWFKSQYVYVDNIGLCLQVIRKESTACLNEVGIHPIILTFWSQRSHWSRQRNTPGSFQKWNYINHVQYSLVERPVISSWFLRFELRNELWELTLLIHHEPVQVSIQVLWNFLWLVQNCII